MWQYMNSDEEGECVYGEQEHVCGELEAAEEDLEVVRQAVVRKKMNLKGKESNQYL